MKNEISINIGLPQDMDICSACFGTGKLKAMQSMATYDAGSIRGPDKLVKCTYCNGTGFRRKKQ